MIYKNNKSGQLRRSNEVINRPRKGQRAQNIHESFGKKPAFIPVYPKESQKVSVF
jgi:hypothetical protein